MVRWARTIHDSNGAENRRQTFLQSVGHNTPVQSFSLASIFLYSPSDMKLEVVILDTDSGEYNVFLQVNIINPIKYNQLV